MGIVIPLEGAGNKKRASLDPLVRLVEPDMDKVNESILARAQSHVELIPEIANHLINSGGKRIRPMLTLAAATVGAIFYGLAGARHLPGARGNAKRLAAAGTDIWVFIVLAAYVAARLGGG